MTQQYFYYGRWGAKVSNFGHIQKEKSKLEFCAKSTSGRGDIDNFIKYFHKKQSFRTKPLVTQQPGS